MEFILNQEQVNFTEAVKRDNIKLVFLYSPKGTGKHTAITSVISSLVRTKPLEETDNKTYEKFTVFIPSQYAEQRSQYQKFISSHMREGSSFYERNTLITADNIISKYDLLLPINDSLVLIDFAQDFSFEDLLKIFASLGENTKVIVCIDNYGIYHDRYLKIPILEVLDCFGAFDDAVSFEFTQNFNGSISERSTVMFEDLYRKLQEE